MPNHQKDMNRETLVHRFSRSVWGNFIKRRARLSPPMETSAAVAGGDGQMMTNPCRCPQPCGAVNCEPGMRYEFPVVFPRLPE